MHIVFWISTTILAIFIFEFGRRIDRARYPDVSFGLVSVLFVSVSVVAFPTSVSVESGRVTVVVPAMAAAFKVVSPDVAPLSFSFPSTKVWMPAQVFASAIAPTLINTHAAAALADARMFCAHAVTTARTVLDWPKLIASVPGTGLPVVLTYQ